MEIKTKFDIGQEVWFVDKFSYAQNVMKAMIKGIQIEITNKIEVLYIIQAKNGVCFIWNDNSMFTTKKEAEQKLKGERK